MLDIDASFVHHVCSSLTPAERLVVMLYYGEGLPESEVAEILEASIDQVEQVLDQARERVRCAREALVEELVELS